MRVDPRDARENRTLVLLRRADTRRLRRGRRYRNREQDGERQSSQRKNQGSSTLKQPIGEGNWTRVVEVKPSRTRATSRCTKRADASAGHRRRVISPGSGIGRTAQHPAPRPHCLRPRWTLHWPGERPDTARSCASIEIVATANNLGHGASRSRTVENAPAAAASKALPFSLSAVKTVS